MIGASFTMSCLLFAACITASRNGNGAYQPPHKIAGAGGLNVWQLIERVERETSTGRHRLRTISMYGDLTDELPTVVLWPPPCTEPTAPRGEFDRSPLVLQRVLAGLRRL